MAKLGISQKAIQIWTYFEKQVLFCGKACSLEAYLS